ncbi:hypothetical protein ADEAN_000258400 [Angomonas deanei]|uniref:Uncharacterized protein n=1 Tax=Angomonas deanei TaxID=59799 RepID=A0A7G2C7X3_9TRYP|nr:hypothetical protein ADEAN_000258400 [Angomonas deanei]
MSAWSTGNMAAKLKEMNTKPAAPATPPAKVPEEAPAEQLPAPVEKKPVEKKATPAPAPAAAAPAPVTPAIPEPQYVKLGFMFMTEDLASLVDDSITFAGQVKPATPPGPAPVAQPGPSHHHAYNNPTHYQPRPHNHHNVNYNNANVSPAPYNNRPHQHHQHQVQQRSYIPGGAPYPGTGAYSAFPLNPETAPFAPYGNYPPYGGAPPPQKSYGRPYVPYNGGGQPYNGGGQPYGGGYQGGYRLQQNTPYYPSHGDYHPPQQQ